MQSRETVGASGTNTEFQGRRCKPAGPARIARWPLIAEFVEAASGNLWRDSSKDALQTISPQTFFCHRTVARRPISTRWDRGLVSKAMRYVRLHKRIATAAAITIWSALAAGAQPSPKPSLGVTPSTGIASSGEQGGPFSPWSFQYRVSASSGAIRYAIVPPFWLTANPRLGTAGSDGVMLTLTVNERAPKLPPGTYRPAITFTNVTNGQGTTNRNASLVVRPSSRGYLLDDAGRYLLDSRKQRLFAR